MELFSISPERFGPVIGWAEPLNTSLVWGFEHKQLLCFIGYASRTVLAQAKSSSVVPSLERRSSHGSGTEGKVTRI